LSYLTDLTLRLAWGAARLDPGVRERNRDWLRGQQRADGGFAGREGESDPYYTAFGLRGLLIVDGIDDSVADRAAGFLVTKLAESMGVVDRVSLIMAASILEMTHGLELIGSRPDVRDATIAYLESHRCGDGGYAKLPGGVAGSTYQTFLNLLAYELLGFEAPNVDRIVQFLDSQRMLDGGFREIRVAKRAGVNPTAAGIGALKALGQLDPVREQATIEFLADMATDEGGLSANDRISLADLLSSCTGMVTMSDLGATGQLNLAALRRYAMSMQRTDGEQPQGGFHGFAFDREVDVEYTFYGLALLALIEAHQDEPETETGPKPAPGSITE
jgi:geranylgeranyl transferase type-2 subunit beta